MVIEDILCESLNVDLSVKTNYERLRAFRFLKIFMMSLSIPVMMLFEKKYSYLYKQFGVHLFSV